MVNSFIQHLLEKRSKVKQDMIAYDILKQYKDDPTIYISMTQIDKIGINPQSNFNTPLGIYTYPLKDIWKDFNHKLKRISVPYKEFAPYINIVKQTGQVFVNDLYKDYSSSDYDRDMEKIKKLYKNHKAFAPNKGVLEKSNKIIQNYKDDFIDYTTGKKILEIPFDSTQTEDEWFKSKGYQKNLGDIKIVLDKFIKDEETIIYWETHRLEQIIRDATRYARYKNAVSAFWNVTRMVALHMDNNYGKSKIGNSAALKWNIILRALGYAGFADKSSKGIIHPAEPLQAVFLTKSAFKLVSRIQNISTIKTISIVSELIDYLPLFNIYRKGSKLLFILKSKHHNVERVVDRKFENPDWITDPVVKHVTNDLNLLYDYYNNINGKLNNEVFTIISKKINNLNYDIVIYNTIRSLLVNYKHNTDFDNYFKYLKKYKSKNKSDGLGYFEISLNYDPEVKKHKTVLKKLVKYGGVTNKVSDDELKSLGFNNYIYDIMLYRLVWGKIKMVTKNPDKYIRYYKYLKKYAKLGSSKANIRFLKKLDSIY